MPKFFELGEVVATIETVADVVVDFRSILGVHHNVSAVSVVAEQRAELCDACSVGGFNGHLIKPKGDLIKEHHGAGDDFGGKDGGKVVERDGKPFSIADGNGGVQEGNGLFVLRMEKVVDFDFSAVHVKKSLSLSNGNETLAASESSYVKDASVMLLYIGLDDDNDSEEDDEDDDYCGHTTTTLGGCPSKRRTEMQ